MSETESPSRPLVVYVDDERGNRVVFEQSLGTDFNIRVCADAETALELVAKDDVAVVVTDMRMPTMNGEELLRIVKERSPQTIRMVVTAYADIDPILRAINEGLVARYIIKPWVRAELVQVLRWATDVWVLSRDSAALHRRLLETERLATIGSVVGMMVHDLAQPVQSLLWNVSFLEELVTFAPMLHQGIARMQNPPPNHARAIELLEDLIPLADDSRKTADHLMSMIATFRQHGKPHDPKNLRADTDPLPVVRHAMAVCQDIAITGHAQIGYQGPGTLPHVRMSATELTQVLINLVANGAQAVAARGAPNGKVSIVARTQEGVLELAIRDDGIGMDAEVLKRVGSPFFTTRAEGTGLGIAQCQRLIGTAGGRLKIESEPGVGTTVTITIPIAA